MKFTIPLTPEIIKGNTQFYWEHINGRKRERTITFSVLFAVMLLLFLLRNSGKVYEYIFIGYSLCGLLVYVPYFFVWKKNKAKYISNNLDLYAFVGEVIIELTEKEFIYHTSMFESRVNWKLIRSYTIVRDTLLLNYYESAILILDKKNVPEVDFNEILAFIKGKVPLESSK